MKNLEEIVPLMNQAINDTALSDFYAVRADLKGGNKWKGGLLKRVRTDVSELSGYAFHEGGRSELQFNVGFEEGGYFRYGVAFSLKPSRDLPDPVAVLRPRLLMFNDCFNEFPELRGLRMWRYEDGVRTVDERVQAIPDIAIRRGTFIFVGERVRVDAKGVTPDIIKRAASIMASLLPLYKRVESGIRIPSPYKVARLCWNTDLWQRPTGRLGKANSDEMFEGQYGFGHEEWLFDQGRLLNGWKYGFIQALNRLHDKYAGEQLNLLLYTIDSKSKSRYWVALIKDVHVLSSKESAAMGKLLKNNGWLREMREEVKSLGLDDSTLSVAKPTELLNLKYKPESLTLFDPPIQFPAEELPAAYYGSFQQVPASQAGIYQGATGTHALIEGNIKKLKAKRKGYCIDREVDLTHKRWQQELGKNLKKILPGADVYVEVEVSGHPVDVLVVKNEKKLFIELKTCSVVRQAIRQALSQLLEYSFWPPAGPRSDALLIVCAGAADESDHEYMELLRKRFSIPVYYLQYSEGSIDGIEALVDLLMK